MTGTVRYNGRMYAALDSTAPDDFSPGCQAYFLPLRQGWDLAADDETSRQVVGAHPWGASIVLLKSGAGYYTQLTSWATPGSLCCNGLLESNGTAFRARTCSFRILIQSSINVSDLGGAVSCAACSPGTYALASQSSECSSCPPGTYSTAHGAMDAAVCSSCYDGTFAPAGSSSCALCIFGTYSGAAAGACSPCEAGKYAADGSAGCGGVCVGKPAHASFVSAGGSAGGCLWACDGGYEGGQYGVVLDLGYSIIRKVNLGTGEVVSLTGRLDNVGGAQGHPSAFDVSPDGSFILIAYSWTSGNSWPGGILLLQGSTITLVAGGQSASQDGTRTDAQFRFLGALSISRSGGFALILDTDYNSGNSAIRRLTIGTWEVTTVAGGGAAGYQDGVGTNARFNYPSKVSMSSDDSFALIADSGNHRIRRLSLVTGDVSTVAGSGNCSLRDGVGTHFAFC
jgi:hypothetical protein